MGVDHGRNACVGSTNERDTLFDGAHARLREVLLGARDLAKPSIIGDLKQMCCSLIEGGGVGRKDRLIADQWCEAANPLDVDWLRVCACGVAIALLCGKAADAEARKPVAIRDILTKGDEMMFVVDGSDLAGGT